MTAGVGGVGASGGASGGAYAGMMSGMKLNYGDTSMVASTLVNQSDTSIILPIKETGHNSFLNDSALNAFALNP